ALPQTPAGTYVGPEEGGRAKPRYEETLPNGVKHYVLHWQRESDLDNVRPFKVPAGHYFMMGDNRDDSIDSRVQSPQFGVGFVPHENSSWSGRKSPSKPERNAALRDRAYPQPAWSTLLVREGGSLRVFSETAR